MKKIFIFLYVLHSYNIYPSDLDIKPLKELLPTYPEIEYIKCHDAQLFEYKPFPISKFPELQPHEGLFAETFILKIQNGQTGSTHCWVKVDNAIIEECLAPYLSMATHQYTLQQYCPFKNIKHIKGRVAVLGMMWDDGYFHWIGNVLGRLALLEMNNIEYDWLFVAQDKKFMKETLALWGIDPAKIITPFGDTKYIVADELIVPSHPGTRAPLENQYPLNWVPIKEYCKLWNIDPNKALLSYNMLDEMQDSIPENISIENCFIIRTPLCSMYFPPYIIDYIRKKLTSHLPTTNVPYSKKVFISRADAPARKMTNEDEVFNLFEPFGFKRYNLGKMSALEQFTLFHNADIIVGAHGAGLVNMICCKQGTTLIEIFQSRSDACFYYLSQVCNLKYHYIQTMEFKEIEENGQNIEVPLTIIEQFINQNLEVLHE